MFFTNEMPEKCNCCPCFDYLYGTCNLNYRIVKGTDDRPKDCPLQEVKQVKWIKGKTDRQYCPICHEVRHYYFKETPENNGIYLINWEHPYCPNCVAKMNGKD